MKETKEHWTESELKQYKTAAALESQSHLWL
jgi:hypothetical protein